MHTAPLEHSVTVPSIFDHFPRVATQARYGTGRRTLGLIAGIVAAPLAGAGLGLVRGSLVRGLAAGSAVALGLGLVRWQLARWFTPSPAYEREAVLGDLELRRYPARIEARTEIDAPDFERALSTGFGRLACYIFGANAEKADVAMTTPVLTTMRDGRYTMSFVMPPAHPINSLPHPDDTRIELREVPEKRFAVVKFHGRFTRDNIDRAERELLARLVDAGLSAKGSALFAGYDSPATLPALRRNEMWIEIV